MQPHLLFRPRRINTNFQNILHLCRAGEHDIPRQIPPDALGARRARQAPLVRKELLEVVHFVDGEGWIEGDVESGRGVAEGERGRELFEEFRRRFAISRVNANGEDGAGVAKSVDVDEVKFGF